MAIQNNQVPSINPAVSPTPPPQQALKGGPAPAPAAPTDAERMEAELKAPKKPDGQALAAQIGEGRNEGGKAKDAMTQAAQKDRENIPENAKDSTGSTMQAVGGGMAAVGGIVAMLPIPVVAQIVGGVIAAIGALTALAGHFVQKNADAKAAVVAGEEKNKGIAADAKVATKEARPNIIAENQPVKAATEPSPVAAATLDAAQGGTTGTNTQG